ncbi:MAG: sodium ion-translocating decarboxylase subunit beta, partial [Clostridia bacterium]|nr:sodium ion-translocating decarboxylase subunit beta [Clostridia bacterium]
MISFFSTIPSFSLGESLKTLWESTGFMTSLTPLWQNLIMMIIAGVLIYLAIAKEFEPNLLVAIGFGMFIINIPGAYQALYGIPMTFDGSQSVIDYCINHGIDYSALQIGDYLIVHGSKAITEGTEGLFFYLYKGVEWVIYPPLIFLG